MSLESDLFAALKGLVGGRVYPDTFPQASGAAVWPAIRYSLVGGTTTPDIAGTGSEETDDVRVQIDIVDASSAGRKALKRAVRSALTDFAPPALLDGPALEEYDAETKTYRASMDFLVCGSSA